MSRNNSSLSSKLFTRNVRLIVVFTLPLMLIVSIILHVYLNYYEEVRLNKNIPVIEEDIYYNLSDIRFLNVRKYCNFLENIQSENEHSFEYEKFNLKLKKLIVLIRHGDRGPLRNVKNLEKLSCDKSFYLNSSSAKQDLYLNLTRQLLQHRSNINLSDIPSIYTEFPTKKCLLGSLTQFGMSQHVKLGYLLSSVYSHKLNLSKDNLDNSVKVLSTPYSRTFQSALSFLYGLFSQLNVPLFSNFPNITFTHGIYFCGFSESDKYCLPDCPIIENLHIKLRNSKLLNLKNYEILQNIVDNLRKIISPSEIDFMNFKSAVSIFDALNAYICHQEKLPCDLKYGCVSTSQVRQIISYIEYLGRQLIDSRDHMYISWMQIYGYLNTLIDIMNNSEHKITLFSGHDVTIEALSSALKFYDGHIPPYASRVIIESYDWNNTNLFRIIYNGKDVTKHLEMCKVSNNCITFADFHLARLDNFQLFITQKFYELTKTFDYFSACNSLTSNISLETIDYDSRV